MTKRCKNCGWLNEDSNVKCQKCNAPLDGVPTSSSNVRATTYEAVGGYQTTSPSDGESFRKTVSENQFFGTDLSGNQYMHPTQNETPIDLMNECPVCHYQVRPGASICPNCGTNLSGDKVQQPQAMFCPKCGAQNTFDAKFCNHCGALLSPNPQYTNRGNENGAKQFAGTVNPWMHPSSGTFCTLKPIAWEGENVQHSALSFSGSTIILNRANTDPNNQSITSQEQAELTCEDGEWYIIDKSKMHTTYVLASRKMKLNKGDIIVLGNRLFEFN